MSKKKPARGSRSSASLVPSEHPEDCLCAICSESLEPIGWSDDFHCWIASLAVVAVVAAAALMFFDYSVKQTDAANIGAAKFLALDAAMRKEFDHNKFQPSAPKCGASHTRFDGAVCRECTDSLGGFSECAAQGAK